MAMTLTGRRLTAALVGTLVAVLMVGGLGAWFVGRAQPVALAPGAAATDAAPTDDRTVRIEAGAAQHGRAEEIRALLQRYFDAINARDYPGWAASVSSTQSAAESAEQWQADYASTTDTNVRVRAIENGPLRVRLTFTSRQDVALAPPDLPTDCIEWDVTYVLDDEDGGLVVNGVDPAAFSRAACG